VLDELIEGSMQEFRARLPLPGHDVISRDRQGDGEAIRVRHLPCWTDPRAHSKRRIVDLGLWQVKRILAFNVSRAHVVADGVSEDFTESIENQDELWFRHALP
jgi:hypothetical protein